MIGYEASDRRRLRIIYRRWLLRECDANEEHAGDKGCGEQTCNSFEHLTTPLGMNTSCASLTSYGKGAGVPRQFLRRCLARLRGRAANAAIAEGAPERRR